MADTAIFEKSFLHYSNYFLCFSFVFVFVFVFFFKPLYLVGKCAHCFYCYMVTGPHSSKEYAICKKTVDVFKVM